MSEADREKWDGRYRDGSYRARTHPTAFLEHWLPHLPRGRALDLACGAGRNAMHLAGAGYRVDAVDISEVALQRAAHAARERHLQVRGIAGDLDVAELETRAYDVIVVARYINRALVPRIERALADGGHLVYEHHLATTAPVAGPSTPQFRVQPNELLELFRRLRVLHYHEGIAEEADGRRMALAQLVACRGSPGF